MMAVITGRLVGASSPTALPIPTVGQVVENVTALRTIVGSAALPAVTLRQFAAAGPNLGGGVFAWDTVPRTDDGGTRFNLNPGSYAGWRRIYSGPLDVTWFGAVGDATFDTGTGATTGTDSTAAFQAAIAALPSGGTLLIPRGGYILSADLEFPSNITIRGEGRRATFLYPTGAVANVFTPTTNARSHSRFEHLGIRWFSRSNIVAFDLTDASRCTVLDCLVEGYGTAGSGSMAVKSYSTDPYTAGGGWENHVHENDFYGLHYGVWLGTAAGANTIVRNTITGVSYAIRLGSTLTAAQPAAGNRITHNRLETASDAFILLQDGCEDAFIDYNWFEIYDPAPVTMASAIMIEAGAHSNYVGRHNMWGSANSGYPLVIDANTDKGRNDCYPYETRDNARSGFDDHLIETVADMRTAERLGKKIEADFVRVTTLREDVRDWYTDVYGERFSTALRVAHQPGTGPAYGCTIDADGVQSDVNTNDAGDTAVADGARFRFSAKSGGGPIEIVNGTTAALGGPGSIVLGQAEGQYPSLEVEYANGAFREIVPGRAVWTPQSLIGEGKYGATLLEAWLASNVTLAGGDVTAIGGLYSALDLICDGGGLNRPTIDSDGWNALQPTVNFNGSDQWLTCDAIGAALTGTDKAWSIVLALKLDATTASTYALSMGRGASATPFVLIGLDGASKWNVVKEDDTAAAKSGVAGSAANTSQHILSIVCTGTTIGVWLDGAVLITPGTDIDLGATTLDRFTLGAVRLNGAPYAHAALRFAGMIATSGALSTDERRMCEAWLRGYGGYVTQTPTWTAAQQAGIIEAWAPTRYAVVDGGCARLGGLYRRRDLIADAATQPSYAATGWNGTAPTLVFDGVNDLMTCDVVGSLLSGTDVAWWVCCAVQLIAVDQATAIVSFGHKASDTAYVYVGIDQTTNKWIVAKQDSAGAGVVGPVSGADADTSRHILTIVVHGTTMGAWLDGAPLITDASGFNVGETTLNQFTLGGVRLKSAPYGHANVQFGAIAVGSGDLNSGDRALVEAFIAWLGYTP